jgi:acyl-CoA thioesterase FadM
MRESVAFVVATMAVRHHREINYGETVHAQTWVRDFRRGVLTRREVRIIGEQGPVADASQQWVHVATGGSDESGSFTGVTQAVRGSDALVNAFPTDDTVAPSVTLPSTMTPQKGPVHEYATHVWHTWMDPLAHVNHPAYLDWADEGTARVLANAGHDPQSLVPVAEHVRFRAGVAAGVDVRVQTWMVGQTEAGDVVIQHRFVDTDEVLLAQASTVRQLVGGDPSALIAALIPPDR